jgi:hypothetical protein
MGFIQTEVHKPCVRHCKDMMIHTMDEIEHKQNQLCTRKS